MGVEVGKFTLESLTTGMYSEPESCYREYIQNAVDSIDIAVNEGLLNLEDSRIEILVDEGNKSISIKDNGIGVAKGRAESTLLNIGNSTKLHASNRGFRGIGRLGGLSYCDRLSFCTSAFGEREKTLVIFDCAKLKTLLIPGENMQYNLQDVIDAVTEVRHSPEQESAHYFIVKMEGVDDTTELLNYDAVRKYLMQVAPVPFIDRFYWARKIKDEFKQYNYKIPEYPIFLGTCFEDLSQIFKPYKLSMEVKPRSGISKDEIEGLSLFSVKSPNGDVIACGWYADTSFLGEIVDGRIAGIRIRQGNILIGNGKTISRCFKEARFNNWSLGEIYILSSEMIPNARRDDFEKNKTLSAFEEGICSTIGTEIPKKCRAASLLRNNPTQKALRKVEKTIQDTRQILEGGFHSAHEKEQVIGEVRSAQKDLAAISKTVPDEIDKKKREQLEQLKELEESVENSTNYKIKRDISSEFSKRERKIVQVMMEVLSEYFARETVNDLYEKFLEKLQ